MLTYDPTERTSIATRVYSIVAAFADPSLLMPWELDGVDAVRIAERLEGKTVSEIEAMVRALCPEAESMTLAWQGHPNAVVSEALIHEVLFDDYCRMRDGEQWMAFDGPEQDDQSLRPATREHCPNTDTYRHTWDTTEGAATCTACGGSLPGFTFTAHTPTA